MADNGQDLHAAKHIIAEGPDTAPDAKRIKSSHNEVAVPVVKPAAITRVVPFPDKVCLWLLDARKCGG